ncbi:MAG: hypothetical protein JSS77_11215 [Acidobacteria bacterium]|nr:hypothetical protein [Acidobacteriota bacterium]
MTQNNPEPALAGDRCFVGGRAASDIPVVHVTGRQASPHCDAASREERTPTALPTSLVSGKPPPGDHFAACRSGPVASFAALAVLRRQNPDRTAMGLAQKNVE